MIQFGYFVANSSNFTIVSGVDSDSTPENQLRILNDEGDLVLKHLLSEPLTEDLYSLLDENTKNPVKEAKTFIALVIKELDKILNEDSANARCVLEQFKKLFDQKSPKMTLEKYGNTAVLGAPIEVNEWRG